jgi:hypothetical protein
MSHGRQSLRVAPLAVLVITAAAENQTTAAPAVLVRRVAAVHLAALPLLIPTWIVLAAAWWFVSASHASRDLAILSLAVYLVVTPAHEALHDVLRAGGPLHLRPLAPSGARQIRSPRFRQPAHACTVHSASS